MQMNDLGKHDEICNTVVQNLRHLGVKYRSKKGHKKLQDARLSTTHVFHKPLHLLQHVTVKLDNGATVQVPQLVRELCSYICRSLETEGLFRKAGSTARQKEIKLLLDAGCELSSEHHVIDVGNVLKLFFRELPEPLIPYTYHELFLQCLLAKKGEIVQAVMLACLLLPPLHLNTLTYFMEFLQRVVTCSKYNKMDVTNIAIVMTPTVMPIEDKIISYTKTQRIPHHVQIVQVLIENASKIGVVPKSITDTIFTPQSNIECTSDDSTEKKKKKRRSTSLTRMFNGLKKMVGSKSVDEHPKVETITPDLLMTPCLTRSAKKRKGMITNGFSNKRRRELLESLPSGSALANTPFEVGVTPVCRHPKPEEDTSQVQSASNDSDFLCIPKSEYEEIKSRVSAIEDRITQEFSENVRIQPVASSSQVQAVYEKTLEEVGTMSPTTEHLARRLSRELKIRRSSEHKVIRSPSARKIGSIRRRSQEGAKVTRNQSCHIPRATLKRGRPNTVMTGLPHPSPVKADVERSSSFNGQTPASQKKLEKWNSAEVFFQKRDRLAGDQPRDSLARLRTQNAGMVLAKAKLFNELSDGAENVTDKRVRKSGTFPRQQPNLKRQRAFDNVEKENKVEDVSRKVRSPRKPLCDDRKRGKSKSPKKLNRASLRVHFP